MCLNQQQVGCIIKFHQQECRFDNYLKLMAKSHQNKWGCDHGHFVRTSEVLNCWCVLWVDHEMAVGHFTQVTLVTKTGYQFIAGIAGCSSPPNDRLIG
jgi:hypothetical protein